MSDENLELTHTILVIEDETDIAELIAFNLERSGMRVIRAEDGEVGLQLAYKERPDLIVLDLMLPTLNGIGVLKGLKRDARTLHTPVILLTARAQTEDRIQGLTLGADDYVTKPFSPKELVLRVKAILKRMQKSSQETDVEAGPFRFDKNSLKFYISNDVVELTSTEFKLMLFLCERANQTMQRNDILRYVWGFTDEVISRTLDTHMKRLRKKLGAQAELIETVRGIGYRFLLPKQ
jgi:two-component system, OmpR family, phosphate regulon response regulator PhoB